MTSDMTPAEQALGDALAELGDRLAIHPGVLRPYGIAPGLLKALRPLVVADELDAIAKELRQRAAPRGVPATVDARWLESRAAEFRASKRGGER